MDQLFAIVDIETTGGKAARDKITEIAIVLHNGQSVVDTFESLINPEVPIPYGITELTGITNEMVADAPRFFEVAKQVVKMTEGAVFVAHNVRFDYSFVQEEFRRLGFTYIRKQLCTVRLARKAFPGFHSYSLGNLILAMGLKAGDRHRAMGDTMATVDLFERILATESTEDNIHQMVNLGVKEALLPKNFSLEKLHTIPEACGVYYFHDEKGEVVYVGKSLNIKKRIAEHFSVKTEKAGKLQQAAHDISWEVTGSELVALLLESHEIKRIRPGINRAQKIRQFPYVIHAFTNQEGYLCFDVAKTTAKTRKNLNIVAEYPKLSHAKGWLKGIQRQYELCLRHCHLESKHGACFDYHLKRCYGACIGEELAADYNQRAEAAMEALDKSFEHPNFYLIDAGRSPEEQAVVMVEDGAYRGFGFGDLSVMNGRPEELRDLITAYEDNPEVRHIIRRFLGDGKGLKMILF
ncbi:MAG: GIY-YIG nuclease family protein [Lewinellaceae bacterium]|nr:GIY-YIG nuclease family protein [Saprospiraceae bacterium]MCB9340344.1 GIY-YIG nuclease family protein [Lewinellaceae bacterium]